MGNRKSKDNSDSDQDNPPYYNISSNDNGVKVGLYSANNEPMPLKAYSIHASIQHSIVFVEMVQTYFNESNSPIETTFLFPTNSEIVISKLVAEVGDKLIECKVMEREKAQ
jgi:hypothetical protein